MRQVGAVAAGLVVLLASPVQADTVVIGNPSAPSLSKDQAADIFLGKSSAMIPVDHPEAAPIRAEFYKRLTGRSLVQVKSIWARQIFAGNAQLPKELPDAAAVKRAVANDAKTVGYVDKSAVDASVKVLYSAE